MYTVEFLTGTNGFFAPGERRRPSARSKPSVKQQTGRKVKFLNATGVSDGRYYADDGIEIINFGPGSGAQGHAANEIGADRRDGRGGRDPARGRAAAAILIPDAWLRHHLIPSRQRLWRCARTMNWLSCGAEFCWEQNSRIPFGAFCPIPRLAPIADCCAFWRALSFPLERFVTLDAVGLSTRLCARNGRGGRNERSGCA